MGRGCALGVKASTVRGYLPELRARFVAFFGYDPSERTFESFESLTEVEGTGSPSAETGGDGDESDGSDNQGFRGDTGSAGGGVNPLRLEYECTAGRGR